MHAPISIILPEKLKQICVGRLYDDVSRRIQPAVEDRMRDGLGHGIYPHPNFYAYCWYSQGLFWAEVWQRKLHVATYSGHTVSELVDDISQHHGAPNSP